MTDVKRGPGAPRKPRAPRTCVGCGAQFTPKRVTTNQKFCGRDCSQKHQSHTVPAWSPERKEANVFFVTCGYCSAEFWAAHQNRLYCNDICRWAARKNRYTSRPYAGHLLTHAEFNEIKPQLIQAQNGLCKLCSKMLPSNPKHVHLDHSHETGAVRGVLCRNCNVGLGLFNDDATLLRRAAEYLDETK